MPESESGTTGLSVLRGDDAEAWARTARVWRGPPLRRRVSLRRDPSPCKSENFRLVSLTTSVILCLRSHLDAGNPRHEVSGAARRPRLLDRTGSRPCETQCNCSPKGLPSRHPNGGRGDI